MPSNSTPHTTSTSILIRLRNQEPEAWARFDSVYRPYIVELCKSLQVADKDDIAQQVLIKVHHAIDGFDRQRKGSFRAWLRTITVNLIADLCKSRHLPVAAELLDKLAEPTQDRLDAEQVVLYENIVATAGDIFSEKWVRCFLGMTVYGISSDQLAEELDMSRGAVRKANYMVLHRLIAEFGDMLDKEED